MPKFIDLTGHVYGRLTVLHRVDTSNVANRKATIWMCECECGQIKAIRQGPLRNGTTRSCGCLYRERHTTHGHSIKDQDGRLVSREYVSWLGMIQRTENKKFPGYKDYGGRGITMCEQWRKSFEVFLEDMGPKPSSRHSLDRINVDGNYEPGNCRWATPLVQMRNTRWNRNITWMGKTQCLQAWANELGMSSKTLSERLRTGWSVEAAFATPLTPHSLRFKKHCEPLLS